MLSNIFQMIFYPVIEYLKMMADSKIESYLGVSLISAIVTFLCIAIVMRALINPISAGFIAAHNSNYVRSQGSAKKQSGYRPNISVKNNQAHLSGSNTQYLTDGK